MCKIEVLEDGDLLVKIPMSLRCVAGRKRIVTPGAIDQIGNKNIPTHPALIAIARAFYWQHLIDSSQVDSASAIAKTTGLDVSYVTRILRFNYISPKIIRLFLNGSAPDHLTVNVLRKPLPDSWPDQEKLLLKIA